MKKMMIALAAVALAGAAQAETWTFGLNSDETILDGYKAATVGGTSEGLLGAGYNAYLISVNYSPNPFQYSKASISSHYTSQYDFLTNLRAENDVAKAAGDALIGSTTTAGDGLLNALTADVANYQWNKNTLPGESSDYRVYAFLAVVVGNDVFLSDTSYYTRSKQDDLYFGLTSYGSDTRQDVDGTVEHYYAGWYSLVSPVPEPTSGLLMLVGMAGLALRRRRV